MHHQHHTDYVEVVSSKGPQKLSPRMKAIFIIMMVVGFGALLLNALVPVSVEDVKSGSVIMGGRIAWIALLHNFYFFTGLSAAGVVIAAIVHITRAMWGRPIKRFAEAFGAFLPWSLLFFIIFAASQLMSDPQGLGVIYEWLQKGPDAGIFENKAWWLTPNFVFGRCLIYLLVLAAVAHLFTKQSTRADMGLAHETNPDLWQAPAGWKGIEAERESSQHKQGILSAVYCMAFAYFISLIAYDLLMSLDFRWISTMYGGWNFTTFMLAGWGSLVLVTHLMSKRFGLEKYMHKYLYHDLGKLTFGFTVVWGYLMFAQINVIWYGNLSHETGWLITRIFDETWQPYTLVAMSLVFFIPFILGLGKKRKMSPITFAPVVLISLVGIWIERFVQIAPASWYFQRTVDPQTHEVAGQFVGGVGALFFWDAVVFLGFLGLFCLTFTSYLYKRPLMVIADPRLSLGINRH